MPALSERLASLTPEQRDALLRLLEKPRDTRRGGFPALELRPEERYEPFPLTEVQQVYLAGRSGLFDLGTCGTNVYSRLEIAGFDEPPLERIDHMFQRLIEHHEMLRAVLLPDGRQRILAEVPPYHVRVEDLRALPAAEIEERLRVAQEEMRYGRKPVDRWPLFDNLVQLLPGNRLCLHMCFQTFLIDGTSRLRMLHEVVGLLRNPDLVLNPVECSYRDWALLWEDFRKSEPYQRSRAYWLERLPDLPPAPRLPYAPPVGPATPTRFASWFHALTREQWQRLKARAAGLGLTPSATFLAAVAEVLALWSRQAEFTLFIESTYHPPVHPGIETVLGNFNSCIPLPVERWPGGFAERAVRLQEEVQRSLEHQHFPGFEVIREINRRKGGTSAAALPVQVNSVIEYNQPSYRRKVAVKSQADAPAPEQDLVVTQAEFGVSFPQFILMVTAFENPDDTMALAWQAAEGALPPAIAEPMFNALVALVERLAAEDEVWHAERRQVARLLLPERPREEAGEEADIVGYRVELRRVEAELERHPLVRRAVAAVEEGFGGRNRLTAHVLRERGAVLQEEELRSWLAERLPYYMVPVWISIHDALPLTEDGAVDRGHSVPPHERSGIEEELAAIWREVLGRDDLGLQDDFFAIGGDSLKLVQMLSRVQMPSERPFWEFFHEPTVEHLARLIRTRGERRDE